MGKTEILTAIDWIFPRLCWHCREPAENTLCKACLDHLSPLPLADPLVTLEGEGPAFSLVKSLKSGKGPFLAKGLAGFMALQYLKSNLPLPDLIVPVPQSFFRFLQVGYNPSFLLAWHLGLALERPVVQLLKRRRQIFRQALIDRDQRFLLSSDHFVLKRKISIAKKTVLLVDDLMGTGATFRCCAKKLYEGFPLKVFKMACIKS